MRRRLCFVLLILLSVSAPGRGYARTHIQPGHLAVASLAASNNRFGFALFRTEFAAGSGSNIFLSPLSASLALQMAYDGARGTTATDMAQVLGLHAGPSGVRSAVHALLASLVGGRTSPGLRIADALWARSGVTFQSSFLQHARFGYGASARSLDFRSPSAPATINAWVKAATGGKIPSIVDRIPPDIMLYLMNAVYFHGDWVHRFNPAATHPHTFAGAAGPIQVPMMSQENTFSYARTGQVESIALPYGGGRFALHIVLPAPGLALASLVRRVTPQLWKTWTANGHAAFGSISVPRFSLIDDQQLVAPLTRLGMGTAFSDGANFSGMCVMPCRLSQARQKTFLNVDENGTTAAAVTSIGVSPTAVQQPTFAMVVDRPYFISIEDASTGSILFFGAVTSPS